MTNPKHTDTSRSGDLVERLRRIRYAAFELSIGDEAADRIEALEAENERLRGILKQWLETAREHLDTEVAGRTFEALERAK